MADATRLVDYYYTMVPDKPGEGTKLLRVLRDARPSTRTGRPR